MLEIRDISKKLGKFSLENINILVGDCEYAVILGPTGTGKTVLLEIIAGMYRPDKGEIFFNGNNMTYMIPEDRQIGFVYQDYLLFPHLDVRENILFGLKSKKMPKAIMNAKLEYITELLGICDLLNRNDSTLSGGERQRVAIARALITEPKILLLDEPLSALDPQTKEIFQQELKRIHRYSKTITIHITHDFSEAMTLADQIIVMKQGCVEQSGNPIEIFNKPQSRFVAAFMGVDNVYEGKIVTAEGAIKVQINNILLLANTQNEGDVKVAIRSEEIIVSIDYNVSSAQNCIKGKIIEIIPQGLMIKVKLDVGFLLTALITKTSAENLKIKNGKIVYAIFKTTAIHIF